MDRGVICVWGLGGSEPDWGQVVEGPRGALLVEEADVVVDLVPERALARHVQVQKQLLIQPLIASVAALSVGVPARDIERTMYGGSSSLYAFEA